MHNERSCGLWIGSECRHCRATESLRRFLVGLRCPEHTPTRVMGRADAWFLVSGGGAPR